MDVCTYLCALGYIRRTYISTALFVGYQCAMNPETSITAVQLLSNTS